MHAPARPIVVRDDGGDEENGDTEERLRPDCIEHPHAAERGRKQRNRGEQHEPFVRVGPPAVVEAEPPGDVVTRDELRERIWGKSTHVDFDRGINKAITRLRQLLGDNLARPRFIETLPKRGYRFVADVTRLASPADQGRCEGGVSQSEALLEQAHA